MKRIELIFAFLLAVLNGFAQSNVQCEDTCSHIHGLDMSRYQGDVFWETINLETQLKNFMAQCRPGDQDLIPMIDIETKSGLSTEAFRDSLMKFIGLVEKAYKQKPLLYTFTNFYNQNLQGKIDGYPLMIAQYTSAEPVLADGRDFTMWQYTGKGRINGVNGYVDKSRFMGRHSLRELRYRHR